jgi:large subunit ribosomal protein L30
MDAKHNDLSFRVIFKLKFLPVIMIKITQTRSIIGRLKKQKLTIEALGLGRPNYFTIKKDTPQIRGMINVVKHLVKVEENYKQ